MKNFIKTITVLTALSAALCANDVITPIPETIVHDKDKAALGKKLFFDPVLSKNRDISCFSCHKSYGADVTSVSFGTRGAEGNINAPSLFNAVFDIALFHNGRAKTFAKQALDTLQNPVEMNMTKPLINKRLQASKQYRRQFKEVYGSSPSLSKALDALKEYQKTLITPGAKFDRYLQGKAKLSQKEQKGYELFQNYGCISCHNGRNIGGNSYQKFGNVISITPFDKSQNDRYAHTGNPEDKNVFKVPSLRNVARTAPYFHNGSVDTLAGAVNFMAVYNLGTYLQKDQIEAIVAFLHTLTAPLPQSYSYE